MSSDDRQTTADLIAAGRALAPWHIAVDVTPAVNTRDFADAAYPESFGRVPFREPGERFKAALEKVYPGGLAGRSVFDCACNCGGFLFWARDLGAGPCHGIDVREHWIRQAHFLSANRSAPNDDMLFEVGDLYDIPERRLEPYDVVVFQGVFYHLPDPIAALRVAADLTRELLVFNSSSAIGLPDRQLVVARESPIQASSGVYGLAWFPTGPQVIVEMLSWLGFTEIRVNWWRLLPGLVHPRLEILAARDPQVFERFDAAEAQLPPLPRMVERAVSPKAVVVVVGVDGEPLPALEDRRAVPFPSQGGDPSDRDLIAELVRLRGEGADYLLVPVSAQEWMARHPGLWEHLRTSHRRVARDPELGVLFSLLPTWEK